MSTVINTNLASLFAQNSLSNAQNNLATSVQRLSSGLRINSAKDDAAGLAIAQNMQSQLNGTNQSIQNLSNATNLLQTADTSLSTIQDMLLRMKQLATQGYDGSLNATQMQDVVQQMSELRTEMNQTAVRTQFNGISLIASGSSVDRTNGGVYGGQYLTKFAATIEAATFKAANTLVSGVNTLSPPTNGTATAVLRLSNDDLVRQNPGAYTFRAIGDQLTLNYTGSDNVPKQQTVTIEAADADTGANKDHIQTISFDKFGVTLTLTTTATQNTSGVLASNIANAMDGKQFSIVGQASQLTNIELSGAAANSYTFTAGSATVSSETISAATTSATTTANASTQTVNFSALNAGESVTFRGLTFTANTTVTAADVASNFANSTETGGLMTGTLSALPAGWAAGTASSGVITFRNTTGSGTTAAAIPTAPSKSVPDNTLTLTWTDASNMVHVESVDLLTANFTAGTDSAVTFKDAGVSLKIHNYQSQTGAQMANLIANLVDPKGGNAGKLNVVNPGTSSLDFQSGPGSNSYITINTLNVQTDSTGQFIGTDVPMLNVGSSMSALELKNNQTTTADWQSAFKTASAAIDSAIDYISTKRSTFGSQMNRLSYVTTNLTAQSTNLQNSRSAIMDTNFASETATLTKGQIMQQAATAMLAQANQMPNVILSLLK